MPEGGPMWDPYGDKEARKAASSTDATPSSAIKRTSSTSSTSSRKTARVVAAGTDINMPYTLSTLLIAFHIHFMSRSSEDVFYLLHTLDYYEGEWEEAGGGCSRVQRYQEDLVLLFD